MFQSFWNYLFSSIIENTDFENLTNYSSFASKHRFVINLYNSVLTSTFCIFPMLQHTYNNFLVRSYRSNAPVYASILITYLPVSGVVKPIRGASGLIFFNSTNLTPRTILGTKRGSGERRNNQMVEKTSFVSAWDGKMAEVKVLPMARRFC